jgi:hypothetical protein
LSTERAFATKTRMQERIRKEVALRRQGRIDEAIAELNTTSSQVKISPFELFNDSETGSQTTRPAVIGLRHVTEIHFGGGSAK